MDKRVVDSVRVGERAEEALVAGLKGLNGLSMMLVWESVFLSVCCWDREDGGKVCSEKGAKD